MHWTWEEKIQCPESHRCSDGLVSFDIGKVPSYLNLVSSSLSCLGSILIIITYWALRDMRTGAQTVITLLAIADFFTAFGYIIGSSNFIAAFDTKDSHRCEIFNNICEIQSFVTTWSTMSSYCWTCILAFYFFLVLVYQKGKLAARLIPLYNVIAWLSPLFIVGPMLVFGKLGYAPYVASNWCYIKDIDGGPLTKKPFIILYILLGGKLWEIISYIVVIVLYVRIRWRVKKSREVIGENPSLGPARLSSHSKSVDKRLLAIPLLYIILRMWGTLQFFYSLAVAGTQNNGQPGCIPQIVQVGYFIFGLLQAIGDGGQGWGNAILYVFFSPVIRSRLFKEPFEDCLENIQDKVQEKKEEQFRHKSAYSGQDPARTCSSPLVVATEARGYKIEEYDGTYLTTASTGGSSVGVVSRSGRYGPFRAPLAKNSKLINSQ